MRSDSHRLLAKRDRDRPVVVDHVTMAVRDLAGTALRLRLDYGFGTVERLSPEEDIVHLIVPMEPPQYVELVSVGAASKTETETARRLRRRIQGGDQLVAWAVTCHDPGGTWARLHSNPRFTNQLGNVIRPTFEAVMSTSDPSAFLPFFVRYRGDPARVLKRQWMNVEAAAHTNRPLAFHRIDLGGDADELAAWAGTGSLPVRFRSGTRGLHSVEIATAEGSLVTLS